ncbi:MAG: C4-type zinc ribbon domain-containing protein [Nitrospirota bacterium]
MKDQVLLLVKLQSVDLRKSQNQLEEKSLPEQLKAAEAILQKKKDAYAQLQLKTTERDKAKREKELDLKVQEEQIVKLRDRLSKLKTNDEYKANLKEIESAKTRKGELEETLLLFMEEGDLMKKEIAEREQEVTESQQTFLAEQEKINAAIMTLSEATQLIETQWQDIAMLMDKNILNQYKKLIVMRKGTAVVSLNGNICGGCHFSLPPQLVAEIKVGEKIQNCTYCSRMIYLESKVEG